MLSLHLSWYAVWELTRNVLAVIGFFTLAVIAVTWMLTAGVEK